MGEDDMLLSSAIVGYGVLSFFLGYGFGWLFRVFEYLGSDILK
jgi:hypothetical protein